MAGLGETILNTLKFAAGGEGEVQQRVLNKQAIDANQLVLDKQRDKTVAGLIDGTELAQFIEKADPGDRTKPVRSFKVWEAYQKNPEVVTEFLNTVPSALLNAQDEKGNTIKVKIKGIKPVLVEDQEMFAVEVVRPDGKVAPLTRRGTSSPDDNVILMSREDLNGLGTQRVMGMMNNGAFDNSSTFLRDMTDLQDAVGMDNARKEQALRDEVVRMIEADPNFGIAEKRELYEIFSKLEEDALLKAVAGMGIDIDAVFEEYNANRAAEGEGAEGAESAESEESREDFVMRRRAAEEEVLKNIQKGSDDLRNTVFGKENAAKLGQFGDNLTKGISDAAAGAGRDIKAGFQDLQQGAVEASDNLRNNVFGKENAAKLGELGNKLVGATAPSAAAPAPSAAAPAKAIGTFDPGANNSFKAAVDAGIAAINPQIEALRQRATGAAPVDSKQSTITPEIMAAPPQVQEAILGEGLSPEERRQAILDALETNLAKPTGKTVEYVADYMISNGFTTPESLSNAPSAEVANIAFTIAANADVATSADRIKIAQSLLNFAQFGNTETTAKDVADTQIAAARLRQDQIEFANKQIRDEAADTRQWLEDNRSFTKDAAKQRDIIRAGINRDKRGFIKGPMSPEARLGIRTIASDYQNRAAVGDTAAANAYAAVYADVFPEAAAAHILGEPRANLIEWVTGPAQDLWTRAPYREADTNFGSFRVEYDDNDNPKFIYLVTPKGVDAEAGQVNITQFRQSFGDAETTMFLDTIKKTQELKNEQK